METEPPNVPFPEINLHLRNMLCHYTAVMKTNCADSVLVFKYF